MSVCLVYILWSWGKPGAAGETIGHRVSGLGVFRRVSDVTFGWTCLAPDIGRGRNGR